MNPGDAIPVVVFFGKARGIPWWARLFRMRPDFLHCGIIVRTKIAWVYVDPRAHVTIVDWADRYETDAWTICERLVCEHRWTAAICMFIRKPAEEFRSPLPYTCVEAVKRILGFRFGFVFTPYQLFRFLSAHPDTYGVFHDAEHADSAAPLPRDHPEFAD